MTARRGQPNPLNNVYEQETKHGLSGYSYVAALEKYEPSKRRARAQIQIARAANCGHLARICVNCAYAWGWDYTLNFDLTAGGREFANRLVETGQDPAVIQAGKGREPQELYNI